MQYKAKSTKIKEIGNQVKIRGPEHKRTYPVDETSSTPSFVSRFFKLWLLWQQFWVSKTGRVLLPVILLAVVSFYRETQNVLKFAQEWF